MTLLGRVQAFAVRHALWTPETPVIAAVSGGADSVALLLLLHELDRRRLVRLIGVAHLHHHIRAASADEDAALVADLAARLSLPLDLAHDDVPARSRRTGQSLELAARHARLAFFRELAVRPFAPLVALGHTRSDQAETVLLRLARGTGTRGLAGMAPRTGHRIRPLLDLSRAELRAWLQSRGQTWREDASNDDTTIARNHVRLNVLPQLGQLNPSVEQALARAARIQSADEALLDELSARESAHLLAREGDAVRMDLEAIRRLPEAVARRVVRHAFALIGLSRAASWRHTEAVLSARGAHVEFGAAQVELFGSLAVLSSRGHQGPRKPVDPLVAVALTLEVPGCARHPSGWWEVEAAGPTALHDAHPHPSEGSARQLATPAAGTETARAVLDAAALGRHLTIRGWQPGDRVQPMGLGGRKKLQDVFVDRKVPRDERLRVPVVVDAQGRIAWVAGHVLGEPFRVTPHSEAVVVLTLRR